MKAFKTTAMASVIATASLLSTPAVADRSMTPHAKRVFSQLDSSDRELTFDSDGKPVVHLKHSAAVARFRVPGVVNTVKYVTPRMHKLIKKESMMGNVGA